MNNNAENGDFCEDHEERVPTVNLTVEEWRAWRRAAGRQINPQNAEVDWRYALTLDPYGVRQDLPDECRQVGREYFARSPEVDLWISYGDLPEGIRKALWEKHKENLAYPAGLSAFLVDEEVPAAVHEALDAFAREGLIIDTGRRKLSKRTGRYEIVWALAPSFPEPKVLE